MCKWGNTVKCLVTIPASESFTGKERKAYKAIDFCIAPVVKALNKAGIKTRGCCCGHGEYQGSIWLMDGRELFIGWKDPGELNKGGYWS